MHPSSTVFRDLDIVGAGFCRGLLRRDVRIFSVRLGMGRLSSPDETHNCFVRISSNSSWHSSLKPRSRSSVPSTAISRSWAKLLSGSR